MFTSRYKVDIKDLINLAIEDHKKGYEIEAFSILYECIRYNQSYLISVKTKKPIKIKNYKELQAIIKKNTMLENKKFVSKIGRFHTNRGKVVHEMILKKILNEDEIDKWFTEGRKINLRLVSEVETVKSLYGELLFTPPNTS